MDAYDPARGEAHRNDMHRALDVLNGAQGTPFTLVERLPGASGAWAVAALDGTHAVLKVFPGGACDHVAQLVRVVEHLRAAGYPTPRPLHYGPLPGGGCFYLQQRVPGHLLRSPGVYAALNRHELDLLLQVLDRHAGLAPADAPDWTSQVDAVAVRHQGAWAVVAQSPLPAVQRLLETCARRCAGRGAAEWTHGDLVHGDFGPHNVLLDGHGQVTAVIDLADAGRGDRVIDLMGLLYMVEADLLQRVRRKALEVATPAAVTASGVYWMVQRLYLGIQENDAQLERAAQQMLAHIDVLA